MNRRDFLLGCTALVSTGTVKVDPVFRGYEVGDIITVTSRGSLPSGIKQGDTLTIIYGPPGQNVWRVLAINGEEVRLGH